MSHSHLLRRFPRVPGSFAALVHRLGEMSAEDFAVTADVGLGGVGLISSESYGVDAYVRLDMTVEGELVQASGRVVYENELSDGRVEVGIAFAEISPAHRDILARLIRVRGE